MKYNPGDEILRCDPFAFVVTPGFDICDWCLKKKEDLLKCEGCGVTRYCSKSCSEKAWKEGHHRECKLMKKSPENVPSDMSLLMARIALKQMEEDDHCQVVLPDNSSRGFTDLIGHFDETSQTKDKMESFEKHCEEIWKYVGDIQISKDDLFKIYCKLLINSFGIDWDEDISSRVGKGLYLAGSAIDHGCWPNAIWVFSGKTLSIRGKLCLFCCHILKYSNGTYVMPFL